MLRKFAENSPHPYGALHITNLLSDNQIIHAMTAARGMKDPTKALHKVIAVYSSKYNFKPDTFDDIEATFEDSVKTLVDRGADIYEAIDAMEPYTGVNTLNETMIANHVFNVLTEVFRNKRDELEEKAEDRKRDAYWKSMGGKRKRTSTTTRKKKTSRAKKMSTKKKRTNKKRSSKRSSRH